ncbi:MAG TPA: L,D-transpeptidase [Solirubrobacteraceae bacterium]|nr:L,D-transpeptidase [Solirubrobacteraceae bacterium]
MAMESTYSGPLSTRHPRKRALLGVGAAIVLIVVLLAVAVLVWSGVTLAGDSTALARVTVQPLGGTIEHVQAFGPDGQRVPLAVKGGRLTPLKQLTPGEQVSVDVKVRRPGWLGWALGSERNEQLTLHAPVAHVVDPWMTVDAGSDVRVSFDRPVSTVVYGSGSGSTHHALGSAQSSISLGAQPATGTTEIAAAARPWETVGAPMQVSWFPPSQAPVMVSIPASGARIAPATAIHLTFSKPVKEVLGANHPLISPSTPGHWHEANSHTLVFIPSGAGAPLGSQLRVQLPRTVAVTAGTGGGLRTTNQIEWTVPPGSTLRLQQLLAQAGYLPLDWQQTGAPVARTPSAEAQAAVDPPSGNFNSRYSNTPHQLMAMWTPGQTNSITKGAVMKFENENELTADGLAGASVWRLLLSDAIAGKRLNSGYSYVYVHREVPETMTLWHDGQTVVTSPANTGISGAETELGTFQVFEHLPETTMSGTNPDGSHYEDPGIKWVSYFNGGDALHNFNRSSFGSPQSLGCVELPLAASAEIYPYTPIGTLVTIES